MAWDVREREISEEQSKEVKGELINMTHTWDKEESESPTGMEPMPMTSRTHGGHSIHWDTRTHGEQGHFKWVHMWQASCILQGGVLVWWTRVLRWIPKTIGGQWTALIRDDWNPREGKRSPRALKAAVDLSEKLLNGYTWYSCIQESGTSRSQHLLFQFIHHDQRKKTKRNS